MQYKILAALEVSNAFEALADVSRSMSLRGSQTSTLMSFPPVEEVPTWQVQVPDGKTDMHHDEFAPHGPPTWHKEKGLWHE